MARRRVPLARRTLFADRRRAMLASAGVGAALLLVLLLDGIFAGAMRQVTAYLDRSPADVIVSQQGVRTMHMSASALPPEALEEARAVDGVAWAEAIRFTSTVVAVGEQRELTYVIGYDAPAGRGGPRLVAGRPPGAGEAVLDDVAAGRLGVGVGATVSVLGRPFRLAGLSTGGTSIVNTTVFVRNEDFAAVRGPALSYVLVGATGGTGAEALARRLGVALPTATAQTRARFAREEAAITRDMSADVLAIMTVIGFLIALAVIALSLLALTLARLRDYGVVKALGGGTGRLTGVVLAQAAWSVALGLLVAVGLAVGVGAAVESLNPTIAVSVEASSVARVAIGALAVGALASVVPLRRVAAVDPASVFRRVA